jgi:hypothetical protein
VSSVLLEGAATLRQVIEARKIADFIHGIVIHQKLLCFQHTAVDKVLGRGHSCHLLEQGAEIEFVDIELLCQSIKGNILKIIFMKKIDDTIHPPLVAFRRTGFDIVGFTVGLVYLYQQFPQQKFYQKIAAVVITPCRIIGPDHFFIYADKLGGLLVRQGEDARIREGAEIKTFQQIRVRRRKSRNKFRLEVQNVAVVDAPRLHNTYMVQVHAVEDKNRVFLEVIDAVSNPAADVFGKIQQKLKRVMNMKSFLFIGPGDLVLDAEDFHGLPVFIVRTVQTALLIRYRPAMQHITMTGLFSQVPVSGGQMFPG